MATLMTAVRKAAARTSCLILLAPVFAITGFIYAFIFSRGPLSGFQGPLWQSLQFSLRREEHSSAHAADEWSMQTKIFRPNEFQAYPYVSNGYFGQTLPAEGVGYWVQQNTSTTTRTLSINSLSPTLLFR